MEAERSSKTLKHFYQITPHHIPEISHLAVIRTAFPEGYTYSKLRMRQAGQHT
jgi:hypothetical protein